MSIIWLAAGIVIGAAVGMIAQSRRIVPAEATVEGLSMAETIPEARAKLDAWLARHDMRELQEIGWDLINVATDARRTDLQIKQAEAKPADANEVRQALTALSRLVGRCALVERRMAQYRTGSWPE